MSKKKATAISLPLSRTQKIMVSAVGVQSVTQDIVALTTKATEIFLMDFARRAYDQSSDEEFRSNVLEYDDIQKLVHSDPRYDFLIDTTPKRIKFSEALKLVEEAKKRLEVSENTDSNDTKAQVTSTTTTQPESKEPTSDENINTHDNHGEEEEEEDEEEDDDQEDQEQVEEHGDEEGEDDDDDNHESQVDEGESVVEDE